MLVQRTLDGKRHLTIDQCEQGMVLADADIDARMNLVPRWRTMMLPALITSPPNFLTPSILGCESRPFRVEPPPFFCAIFQYSWYFLVLG